MLTLLLAVSLQAPGDWPVYGRDPGGARFSPLTEITRQNVTQLQVAWTYHTGIPDMSSMSHRPPALEVTPIVVDGTMYVITPTGIVAALDPATGAERWRYDAGVNPHRGYGDFASRGVSIWRDSRAAAGASCARRIIAATIDARLVALDAATGKPCAGFGAGGVVDLRKGLRVAPDEFAFYEVTSPPAVVGDLVITGSAVADNTNLNSTYSLSTPVDGGRSTSSVVIADTSRISGAFNILEMVQRANETVRTADPAIDHRADVFLYNPERGQTVRCLTTKAGRFDCAPGTWPRGVAITGSPK